jgi:hypothetical protein
VSDGGLPIVINFEDHFVLTMIMIDPELTMDGVVEMAAPHFIGPTLRPRPPEQTMRIRLQDGEAIPRDMTVKDAKWVDYDVIEIFYE